MGCNRVPARELEAESKEREKEAMDTGWRCQRSRRMRRHLVGVRELATLEVDERTLLSDYVEAAIEREERKWE